MNKNNILFDIIIYIMLQAIVFILTLIIIFSFPVYGVCDYLSESVNLSFSILVFISAFYIPYLVSVNLLLLKSTIKTRRIITILNTCITLLVGLWITLTFSNITNLIINYGGLQADRTIALTLTFLSGVIIIILTIISFFISFKNRS